MRLVLALAAVGLLGGIVSACLFWAGVDQGAPLALAFGGLLLVIVVPLAVGQLGNWGVPGDEPPIRWRRGD
ncbi:MAG TPA: hypothetical protein VH395_04460 [Jatrophihabitantaceae bacterium]|jgi:hypothetical protein